MTRHRMLVVALAVLAFACGSPPSAPPPSVQTVPATATTAAGADPPSATSKAADAEATPARSPAGETDPQVAIDLAKKENKPAFLVFCAAWATACNEMAHVLAETAVKKVLDERFVVARVDMTDDEDPTTRARMKKFNVTGVPCLIVFDRRGKEVARGNSYLDSSGLSKLLDKAK